MEVVHWTLFFPRWYIIGRHHNPNEQPTSKETKNCPNDLSYISRPWGRKCKLHFLIRSLGKILFFKRKVKRICVNIYSGAKFITSIGLKKNPESTGLKKKEWINVETGSDWARTYIVAELGARILTSKIGSVYTETGPCVRLPKWQLGLCLNVS